MRAAKHRRIDGKVRPSYQSRLERRAADRIASEDVQRDLARQYAAEDAAKQGQPA